MGIYRSTPMTDKNTECDYNDQISYAACGMQGWRVSMEDSHIADLDLGGDKFIFGVFDGHGGAEVSEWVKRHFVALLKANKDYQAGKYQKALKDTFLNMDKEMLKPDGQKELLQILSQQGSDGGDNDGQGMGQGQSMAGCTANVSMIVNGQLICANAGDSRTLLCSRGKPYPMSVDHKPDDDKEYNRVTKAGGFVTDGRIDGNLNLSRCIGDFEYKKDTKLSQEEQKIIAVPDFQTKMLTQDDEFMILGCDGIWETMTNDQIIRLVHKGKNYGINKQKQGKEGQDMLKNCVEDLLDNLIAPDTQTGLGCDNMTVVIVDLRGLKKKSK